ncbi:MULTISPECIES: YqjF family protein [Cryobacterium]|uniref:DUF2071 domain-containing protein n=2 Tax=Cryobacterium TaxID=69578 RepID=A0ABY2IR43_9MICO|nr:MULTISPECIES: DUF2071 domain-containing protein [Cryobacterium]MDY7527945.1 DUF2071 domain-containing protein [Cryobacterium sp. 10C2]MDY7556294.1 DUF2071 domain-containing protein [Cryobacterium sp. 10C3]MEB0004845.1 DUF2071 domain-containing protein [Cryobacterium sp. RTC2.1]MEB0203256.1 DUF2071 domain-containing protein [Cryobacterium sp. 5I3]MEB0285293.1 DUF2071 domain-containing protein [Cryobacterium sp. 10S3]
MPSSHPASSIAPPLAGRAVASQRWSHLCFVHWRVPAAEVAPLLPAGLVPDEFDGTSWVGLIPFVLDRATIWGSPPIPYFGNFVEVNVRLYAVDAEGRRGVVFVSLEASRLAAVLAARAAFALPYMWSRTRLAVVAGEYRYSSLRHFAGRARTDIVVRPGMEPVTGEPLADFLTARWALFTRARGRTVYLRNHHEPWELVQAELVHLDDTLLAEAGFPALSGRVPDSVLYSPGVTTRFGTG